MWRCLSLLDADVGPVCDTILVPCSKKELCQVVLPTQPNFVFTVSQSAENFLDINSPYYDLHSLAWHT